MNGDQDILLLRLDAPLMSFGAPMVDERGVIQPFPALSMLTGLLANALGYDHRDEERLGALQERIRYASRCDRKGEMLRDYQTVDLDPETSPWMDPRQVGWTTRGRVAERGGGKAKKGTHIRFRDYWADSVHTVAVLLDPAEKEPGVQQLAGAIEWPARPLFIGRKCCLPATRILLGVVRAPSLICALARCARPDARRKPDSGRLSAWWFDGDDASASAGGSRVIPVTDERDWHNQIHVGRRLMRHGQIDPPEAGHGS
ncbi:MAG: type I-E CRISPR-associated protein Cas5/CasD [Deltaproteobacteria bacterium]|nr:type I-E CRISPR-associated protein Cas5/CasD [Deltaproteobacteria bacterium]